MDVSLRPMTDAEFATWSESTVTAYGEDLARAHGVAVEITVPVARDQFAHMLPHGLDTPATWLFTIVDATGADAGTLWLGQNPQLPHAGYVYDIVIAASRRGEGLGRAAMLRAEEVLRAAGYTVIQLSVFGFNSGARALYDSLGYGVIGTTMAKPLAD